MIIELAKWTLIGFGILFIGMGVLMLIQPKTARSILRKAGSTNLINYSEITLRLIISIAFIIYSENSNYPSLFNIVGWFMLITSFILYAVPRKLHNGFSNKCADILKPIYFQFISPISILIGIIIIRSVS